MKTETEMESRQLFRKGWFGSSATNEKWPKGHGV